MRTTDYDKKSEAEIRKLHAEAELQEANARLVRAQARVTEARALNDENTVRLQTLQIDAQCKALQPLKPSVEHSYIAYEVPAIAAGEWPADEVEGTGTSVGQDWPDGQEPTGGLAGAVERMKQREEQEKELLF